MLTGNRSTKDGEELPEYGEARVTPTQEPGPPRALSIVHDWLEIANGLFSSIEERVIQTQCHHWDINDWEALPVRATSHTFIVQDHRWKLVMYSKGNAAAQRNHFSLYLSWQGDPIDPKAHICVQFALVLSNRLYPSNYTARCGHHRFDPMGTIHVWGYNSMASIDSLRQSDHSTGRSALLQNGQIRVSVIIRVIQDITGYLWDTGYNSRKSVGYVPIRNEQLKQYDQGHVSAMLQLLFCTNFFRRTIFQVHASDTDGPLVAIQKFFCKLQLSLNTVDSQCLDDILHATRDVSDVKNTIQSLLSRNSAVKQLYDQVFGIRFENNEMGYSIILDTTHYDSLEQAWIASSKQIKGFPSVLHIELKSRYDRQKDNYMSEKVKQFTYPEELNMGVLSNASMGKDKRKSKSADIPSQKDAYVLHSVIMRNSSTRKYHAYIRPYSDEARWHRFDNHQVLPELAEKVFQTGKYYGYRTETAQMLQYIRKSKLHEILIDVSLYDIPRHIVQWSYQEFQGSIIPIMDRINLLIVTDDTFRDSKNLDPFDTSSKFVTKIVRNMYSTTVNDIVAFISEHFSVPKETFRLWTIIQRVNKTLRVNEPLDNSDIQSNFRDVLDKYRCKQLDGASFQFYLEHHSGKELNEDDILIFIRYFDVEAQNVRGVGHLIIDKYKRVGSIVNTANAMVGNAIGTALEFYDVVHETLVEKCNSDKTFKQCEIRSGDIICAQKSFNGKEKLNKLLGNSDLYNYYVQEGLMKRNIFIYQRATSGGKDIMPE